MSEKNPQPYFLLPLYPFRAVGSILPLESLSPNLLYELKCPNPNCIFNIRTQGCNVSRIYEKIRNVTGCPACKIQFGEKEKIGYSFKTGEIEHPIPENIHHTPGFEIRQVIYITNEIFEAYAQKLFHRTASQLDRTQTNRICEEFFLYGNWEEIYQKRLYELKKS